MTDIKKVFYNNLELLSLIDRTVTFFRKQNFYQGLFLFKKILDRMMDTVQELTIHQSYFNQTTELVDIHTLNQMLGDLLEAQNNQDYIFMADLLEVQWNYYLRSLQEFIMSKEEWIVDSDLFKKNIDAILMSNEEFGKKLLMEGPLESCTEGYIVEYTSYGSPTLALLDGQKKYYLHSNTNASQEASLVAKEWYQPEKSNYIIYGLGLGYHIIELAELDESIVIHVYESDWNIIRLAFTYSPISDLLSSGRVFLYYDPDFIHLDIHRKKADEETVFAVYYPSLRNIKNQRIREQLEEYFVTFSSVKNQLGLLIRNFRKNIMNYDASVDSLKESFRGKDLYIVAAGPSLDKNFKQLKAVGEKGIILTTGTVFKKLLREGIKPDYVIITDGNAGVYHQIEGVEQKNIPLLLMSTAYYKISQNYQGKKYLICQQGFRKAEEYAEKRDYNLYQTGGSVSTTALDLGIMLGCRRIIFLGLDLAYTGNQDHASGTASVERVSANELRQVEDINGNLVGTAKNLNIYRKWIEKRIQNVKGIEFINATEGGAKIQGMKVLRLEDVLNSLT
jgi:hypothetical protein